MISTLIAHLAKKWAGGWAGWGRDHNLLRDCLLFAVNVFAVACCRGDAATALWCVDLGFSAQARGIRQVYLAGLITTACVLMTMHGAYARGYETILLEVRTVHYPTGFSGSTAGPASVCNRWPMSHFSLCYRIAAVTGPSPSTRQLWISMGATCVPCKHWTVSVRSNSVAHIFSGSPGALARYFNVHLGFGYLQRQLSIMNGRYCLQGLFICPY